MPRWVALFPVLFLLAGCGRSSTAAPTSTPPPGYTDRAARVNVHIVRLLHTSDHALFLVNMRNAGNRSYTPNSPDPFINSALIEPNSPGVIGPCSADSSRGPGLDYSSTPARSTHRGWLRCDYPPTTHVVAVFWLGHSVGAYHVAG